MMNRRVLPLLLAAPALAPRAEAQARPIRVVVPFAAGGIIDVVARIIAEPLGRELGGSLVIENQPGAGSVIGARTVARAAADGQTLMVSGAAHAVIPALYPDAGIDPVRDFTPIALLGQQPFVLALHPSLPPQDVPGFLAWLRARPGQARFATTGIGAASHLAGELLKRLGGVEFEVITYRGTPAAVADLVAGRVDFMLDSQTLIAPLAADGRVRALAVTSAARSALLPALPVLGATLAGYDASSWQAMYGPAGLDAAFVARVRGGLARVLADDQVRQRYSAAGLQPLAGDHGAFLAAEQARWLPILAATGARGG